ncbi:MAG: FecR family protein [candidate division KSB1 bacterium]|nr:FecR family protein [candidate division KSB1 bacterium]MDZ7336070.1 FecR family protein [candidate division KSB1 bacterium]MDZ7358692.1 FecR family protein [candidate division KSB1 bacterium]MDZ7377303.1 FecR family protein [candidate division KSB1 bacterium]MDZ7399610.1 FecR family protein [candidate division KSB1 bacterium]
MRYLNYFILIIGLFIIGWTAPGWTQTSKDIAIILKSKGEVKLRKEKSKDWRDGRVGTRLDSGDMLKTAENSLAAVMFTDDKSLIKVRDNSSLAIRGKRIEQSISKRIICTLGEFWVKATNQQSKLLVETPSGVAAVKGTEFYGIVDAEGNTQIIVVEGIVQLLNKLGEILIQAGQTGKLTKNGAPVAFNTDPNSVLNWAKENRDGNELLFEFQDSNGNKKHLKLIYH